VPVLTVTYDVKDVESRENLKPFIDTTFPGMHIGGTLTQHNTFTLWFDEKLTSVSRGETALTDGLMEGPAAPEYITNMLPGLKLTQYRFRRMTNVYETFKNGDAENRMIFEGQNYDIFIFGTTKADGRINYVAGVDLLASLGSKALTRTLDQGKLPLMYYTGRIKGSKFAELDIRYLLPHEFAYEVFIRRNVLLQLLTHLGEKPPKIEAPKGLTVPPDSETPERP
jgi:hypothetical protein